MLRLRKISSISTYHMWVFFQSLSASHKTIISRQFVTGPPVWFNHWQRPNGPTRLWSGLEILTCRNLSQSKAQSEHTPCPCHLALPLPFAEVYDITIVVALNIKHKTIAASLLTSPWQTSQLANVTLFLLICA